MLRSVLLLISLSVTGHAAFASGWAYSGENGPDHWAEERADFALCASGVNQSPVDIRSPIEAELPPIQIKGSTRVTRGLNNGHTVQFDFSPGVTTTVADRVFALKQVHFHSPSENRIDGKAFAMEAHFVHAADDGELAVIAIMYEAGETNEVLQRLLEAVEKGGGDVAIDTGGQWEALKPRDLDYYYFSGSLTTPPCTEGVHWIVLKRARQVSTEQAAWFRHMVHGANARPVQAPHARMILQ